MPGYDRSSKEIARRFAADEGLIAVMPHLYSREGAGASPDDAAAAARAAGGVPDDRLVGDVEGGGQVHQVPGRPNGKVATIGYCSGGRQSFLAAISLQLDAAVDCYGAFVVEPPPEGMGAEGHATSRQGQGPVLPVARPVRRRRQAPLPRGRWPSSKRPWRRHGKTYEFHSYEGAGHAFFNVDRPSYRPEAAARRLATRSAISSAATWPLRGRRPCAPTKPNVFCDAGAGKERPGGSRCRAHRSTSTTPSTPRPPTRSTSISSTRNKALRRGLPSSSTPPRPDLWRRPSCKRWKRRGPSSADRPARIKPVPNGPLRGSL